MTRTSHQFFTSCSGLQCGRASSSRSPWSSRRRLVTLPATWL